MSRPDLSYLKNILLAIVGVVAGAWCGATGIALAPLLVPLLAWLLGARSIRLGGTVLVVGLSASALSLLAYGQTSHLNWISVASVAVASVAGSLLGSLPQLTALRTSKVARACFTAALIGIGLWMVVPHRHIGFEPFSNESPRAPAYLLVGAGTVAGLFAALANTSGVLIVPALRYMAHLPMLTAQATSLATLAVVSAAPAASSLAQQRFSPPAALWCGFGAALGALYGSRIAIHQADGTLQLIYGISLIAAALANSSMILPNTTHPQIGEVPQTLH